MPINHIDAQSIISTSDDPWFNLAFEEHLLNLARQNRIFLFLWQSAKTVVIGRNQNPWKECRCNLLEKEGGKLSRRLSGGGAVYQDYGNLNFSFIVDRRHYNLERQLQVVLQAVRSLGINAQFSGRNDLVVNDRKFSGNAYYFETFAAYHHGTLLVNTELNNLVKYLQVSTDKIASKGIDSIRSRVINLASLNEEITIDKMINSILASFTELYGTVRNISMAKYTNDINNLYRKYSSWKWRYGESPNFDVYFEKRFSWGNIDIGFTLQDGVIKECTIYSDALDSKLIQSLKAFFVGVPFIKNKIMEALTNFIEYKDAGEIVLDIQNWLRAKNI